MVQEQESITLRVEYFLAFVAVLEAPDEPNAALLRALERHAESAFRLHGAAGPTRPTPVAGEVLFFADFGLALPGRPDRLLLPERALWKLFPRSDTHNESG
jgi:hypothetical protein